MKSLYLPEHHRGRALLPRNHSISNFKRASSSHFVTTAKEHDNPWNTNCYFPVTFVGRRRSALLSGVRSVAVSSEPPLAGNTVLFISWQSTWAQVLRVLHPDWDSLQAAQLSLSSGLTATWVLALSHSLTIYIIFKLGKKTNKRTYPNEARSRGDSEIIDGEIK